MRRFIVLLIAVSCLLAFGVQCAPAAQPPTSPTGVPAAAASPTGIAPAVATVTTQPKQLAKIRYGSATKTITPIVINIFVGEYLGYYAAEGYTMERVTLGSNDAVGAAVDKGDIDIATGSGNFIVPLAAKGEKVPYVLFYENTYPFKWDWVVKPDSPITELAQVKGKKVGVSLFGSSDYVVGQQMLRMIGLDPEKDVQWLAVGEGAQAGSALDKGDIDVLIHYDTGFGLIEMAGIKLRYLPRPKGLPQVGGIYLAATRDFMNKNPKGVVAMGRAVAKGTVFCLENKDACAYVFLQMFPELAPKGKPLKEQVAAIVQAFEKRAKIWTPYDPNAKGLGSILESEWKDEVKFYNAEDKITNVKPFFTNEFIDEINNFDKEAIKKQAREYKIPY